MTCLQTRAVAPPRWRRCWAPPHHTLTLYFGVILSKLQLFLLHPFVPHRNLVRCIRQSLKISCPHFTEIEPEGQNYRENYASFNQPVAKSQLENYLLLTPHILPCFF
jgi:hypothetical protein